MLKRSGRHCDYHRRARLLARCHKRFQRGSVILLEIEPLAANEDIVPAAPSAHPFYRDVLADCPDQMLCGGVAYIKLALLDCEQDRGTVPEVLCIKSKIVLVAGGGQRSA